MPIPYRIIRKAEPGKAGGGAYKWYASSHSSGETGLEELASKIQQMSSLSRVDVQAVLHALVEVIPEELEEGRIVRLGELGSLRMALSSQGHQKREEVGPSSILKGRILFHPGKRLKRLCRGLKFSRRKA